MAMDSLKDLQKMSPTDLLLFAQEIGLKAEAGAEAGKGGPYRSAPELQTEWLRAIVTEQLKRGPVCVTWEQVKQAVVDATGASDDAVIVDYGPGRTVVVEVSTEQTMPENLADRLGWIRLGMPAFVDLAVRLNGRFVQMPSREEARSSWDQAVRGL